MMREAPKYKIQGKIHVDQEEDNSYTVSLQHATITDKRNNKYPLTNDLDKFNVNNPNIHLARSEFFQRWTQYTKRRFGCFIFLTLE
jgi:hypothetical protein